MLALIGLTLAGGILLLWVVWKSARELRHADPHAAVPSTGRLSTAIWRIIIADVSMSLDNILAVAGAARAHPALLAIGLLVSVALMGLAAGLIAAWVGLAIVLYVSLTMIHDGSAQATWVDLHEPTKEQESAVEAAFHVDIPTREEMRSIEAISQIYHEDGALVMITKRESF